MKHSSRVYSTETGRLCPDCEKPVDACICSKAVQSRVYADDSLRIKLETKGRKGKGVTCIEGLSLPAAELDKLAKTLKARCSSGGTVKDGIIEIQGDHRKQLQPILTELGFKSKLSGG